MKPNLSNPGKVVITVATTGGLHGRESNPALPEQPKDIIQNFYNCYNAGGVLAVSNAQLVERAVRIVKELGREVAAPEEPLELMHLGAAPQRPPAATRT